MRNFAYLIVAAGVAAAVAASCAGNDPGGSTKMDAPASGGSGFGATCTTASDTSTECMSGVCTNTFDMSPTPLCSVKCVPANNGSDCPAGSGGVMKCNMKGYCKP